MDGKSSERKRVYTKRRKKEEKPKSGASKQLKIQNEIPTVKNGKTRKADIIPNYESNLIAANQRLTTNVGLFCHGKTSKIVVRNKVAGKVSKEVKALVKADLEKILNKDKNQDNIVSNETSQDRSDDSSSEDVISNNGIYFSPNYDKVRETHADKSNKSCDKNSKADNLNEKRSNNTEISLSNKPFSNCKVAKSKETCSKNSQVSNEENLQDVSINKSLVSSVEIEENEACGCDERENSHYASNDSMLNMTKEEDEHEIILNPSETLSSEEILKRRDIITDFNHFLTGKNYSLFPGEDHYEKALLNLRELKESWAEETKVPAEIGEAGVPYFNVEEPKRSSSQRSSYHSLDSSRKSSVHQVSQDILQDCFVFEPKVPHEAGSTNYPSTPKEDPAQKLFKDICGSRDLMASESILVLSEYEYGPNMAEMLPLETNRPPLLSDSDDLDEEIETRASRKRKNSLGDGSSWRNRGIFCRRPGSSSSSSPEFKFTRHRMI